MKTLLVLLGVTGVILSGCQPNASKSSTAEAKVTVSARDIFAQIAGKTWKLDRWTGADGSDQTPGAITLTVSDDGRVSGSAGVNRYTGPANFTAEGDLALGEGIAVTKMMGLPEAQAREDRYLSELKQLRHVALENGRLVLFNCGKLRLEFVPENE